MDNRSLPSAHPDRVQPILALPRQLALGAFAHPTGLVDFALEIGRQAVVDLLVGGGSDCRRTVETFVSVRVVQFEVSKGTYGP